MNNYYGVTERKKANLSSSSADNQGTKNKIKVDSTKHEGFENCCKQTFVVLSALLGVLSLALIIALNAANLVELYRNKGGSEKVSTATAIILEGVDQIKNDVRDDIKPKVELINSATSFKLPALIGSHSKLLQNDIIKYCSPRFDNEGKDCPVKYSPTHSSLFRLYDPWERHECIQADGSFVAIQNITFFPFISFIPSPTSVDGCNTMPSFSLGSHIYSYTHTAKIRDCYDFTDSSQYWTIGSIKSDQHRRPFFENIITWPLFDSYNRKSCSTVASTTGAWLACTIVSQNEELDLNTTGIQPLNILYLDAFGVRKQWTFQESEIIFDRSYDTFYFSVGPGIIKDGKVIFLAYGALRSRWDVNAYCYSPGCSMSPMPTNTCNSAQSPPFYKFKQVVNAIVEFDDDYNTPPRLNVRTIPPNNYDLGAEGRLYYFPHSNKVLIYKKSSSWHSFLFFGELHLTSDLSIQWYDFNSTSRPGNNGCSADNHCPRVCVTGTYNDYFPLARNGHLGMTVALRDNVNAVKPTIRLLTLHQVLLNHYLTTRTQAATYTTTTCFLFDDNTWCLMISELRPGTVGRSQPISMLVPPLFTCNRPQGASHSDLGSGDMDNEELLNNEYLLGPIKA